MLKSSYESKSLTGHIPVSAMIHAATLVIVGITLLHIKRTLLYTILLSTNVPCVF